MRMPKNEGEIVWQLLGWLAKDRLAFIRIRMIKAVLVTNPLSVLSQVAWTQRGRDISRYADHSADADAARAASKQCGRRLRRCSVLLDAGA